MKKQMVRGFAIGLSYFLIWHAINYTVVTFYSSSPARKAYGILSAWWAALYVCNYINIGIKDIWYLIVPGIFYTAYLGHKYDYPNYLTFEHAFLFFILHTPFLVNLLLVTIKKGLKNKIGYFRGRQEPKP